MEPVSRGLAVAGGGCSSCDLRKLGRTQRTLFLLSPPAPNLFCERVELLLYPVFFLLIKFCFLNGCGRLNEVVAWQRQNVNILYKCTSCDPGTILIAFPNVSGRSTPTCATIALSYSIDVIYDLT